MQNVLHMREHPKITVSQYRSIAVSQYCSRTAAVPTWSVVVVVFVGGQLLLHTSVNRQACEGGQRETRRHSTTSGIRHQCVDGTLTEVVQQTTWLGVEPAL